MQGRQVKIEPAKRQSDSTSVQECWVEIEGQKMRYVQTGAGPPLLLVHGLLGGLFCWRFNVPVLAEHFTVYAVDLPGSGLSRALPETDCSMKKQAERLLQFIDQLQIQDVNVAAVSYGGAVALFLAARDVQQERPRVRAMVLAAPVNPWSKFSSGRIRFLSTTLGGYLLRLAMPFSRPLHQVALRRMYGDPKRIQKGAAKEYARLITPPGIILSLLNTLRSWRRNVEALRAAIPEIKIPVRLVWGTRDGAVDQRSCAILQQQLKNSSVTELPGVGHLSIEEVPEEFNRIVLDFFLHPDPA